MSDTPSFTTESTIVLYPRTDLPTDHIGKLVRTKINGDSQGALAPIVGRDYQRNLGKYRLSGGAIVYRVREEPLIVEANNGVGTPGPTSTSSTASSSPVTNQEPGMQGATGTEPSRETRKFVDFLLVASTRGDEWILPKGGWEMTETFEQGVHREIEEEAGVWAVLESIAGGIECVTPWNEDQITIYCVARATDVLSTYAEPGRARRWFGLEEVHQVLRRGVAVGGFRAALRSPTLRHHLLDECHGYIKALALDSKSNTYLNNTGNNNNSLNSIANTDNILTNNEVKCPVEEIKSITYEISSTVQGDAPVSSIAKIPKTNISSSQHIITGIVASSLVNRNTTISTSTTTSEDIIPTTTATSSTTLTSSTPKDLASSSSVTSPASSSSASSHSSTPSSSSLTSLADRLLNARLTAIFSTPIQQPKKGPTVEVKKITHQDIIDMTKASGGVILKE